MSYNPTDYVASINRSVESKEAQLEKVAASLSGMANIRDTYGVMDASEKIRALSASILSKQHVAGILTRHSPDVEKTLGALNSALLSEFVAQDDVYEAVKAVLTLNAEK